MYYTYCVRIRAGVRTRPKSSTLHRRCYVEACSSLSLQVLLVRTVGLVSIIAESNSPWQGKHEDEEDFGVGRVRWFDSNLSLSCQLCSQSRQWRSFVLPGGLVLDAT